MDAFRGRLALSGLLALGLILGSACRRFGAKAAHSGARYGAIAAGDLTRQYFVHVPPSYDGKKPLPLVLVLHGATQSPESIERMSDERGRG